MKNKKGKRNDWVSLRWVGFLDRGLGFCVIRPDVQSLIFP